jgi:hypothetical protein
VTVGTVPAFHRTDGRLIGCYVYMLLCSDGGPIYVKIGISQAPTDRLNQLRTSCPVRPQVLAVAETFSRKEARRIENGLHQIYDGWRHRGEWFLISAEDKPEFNRRWREVFTRHSRRDWPLAWEQISVKAIDRLAQQRQAFFRKRMRRRGASYKAFVKDGGLRMSG